MRRHTIPFFIFYFLISCSTSFFNSATCCCSCFTSSPDVSYLFCCCRNCFSSAFEVSICFCCFSICCCCSLTALINKNVYAWLLTERKSSYPFCLFFSII